MLSTDANLPKLKLVLASASPRRKELLSLLEIPFEIISADIDEDIAENNPSLFVEKLAHAKGAHVCQQLEKKIKDYLVFSADTTVYLDNQILNKPKDRQHAKEILQKLSGNTHRVYTGYSLFLGESGNIHEIKKVVCTEVTFLTITETMLEFYLNSSEPYDKAGAYGIQGKGLMFVDRINGSYSNVVGLPLSDLVQSFEEMQKDFFPSTSHWRELF